MIAVAVLAVLAFFLFVVVGASVRIVRPFQRGVVERLGRYRATVDPGLRIIIPFVDRIRLVDMREQVVDVPPRRSSPPTTWWSAWTLSSTTSPPTPSA